MAIIREGDKIFFTNNYGGSSDYDGPAWETIQSLGLIPIVYGGAGLNVRGSSLEREIRGDFDQSKVVVLLLGKGEGWRDIKDNWALPNLKHALSMGVVCFVYTATEITEEELRSLNLPVDAVTVRNVDQFISRLRQDL